MSLIYQFNIPASSQPFKWLEKDACMQFTVYRKRLVTTCKRTSPRRGTTPTPETWFTWVACHDPPWRTGWHRQRGRLRLKYTRVAVVTEHRWSTLGWGRKLARRESQDKDRKSPNMRHTWGVFSKLGRKYITYSKTHVTCPNTINFTVIIYMCICLHLNI